MVEAFTSWKLANYSCETLPSFRLPSSLLFSFLSLPFPSSFPSLPLLSHLLAFLAFFVIKASLPALHCLECAYRKVHHHQVTAQRIPTNWACSCWRPQSCLHTELLLILLRSVSSANGDQRLVLAKRQTLLGSSSSLFTIVLCALPTLLGIIVDRAFSPLCSILLCKYTTSNFSVLLYWASVLSSICDECIVVLGWS